ncbi:MAG: flagellar protein FlaG [Candidatus Accumulibacter phosphatis]|jgi:flagellar protein FlaG|uniref:flagellar protein FlaG n=1 Tax=Candidatus Accumulibacter phosphatis TaxID=327160 RepID=UPI001A526682|nr:flagellar protein FlaG [Candidatus Accumulibacter phosphatis]
MNIQPSGATLPPQGNPVLSSAARDIRTSVGTAAKAPDPSPPALSAQRPERQEVEAAAKSVREFVQPINSNLEFSVNDDTGQLVVKIIDRATKEVIRQMPSEEMLAIAKTLDSIKGLFVKQTA